MSYNETMTQRLSVADVINSQSINNTSVSSIGINLANFKRLMFVIQAGSLGAAGTLDGRLQSCFESNFAASVHNITNTNLTQITVNNSLATIEIRADQVTTQNPTDQYVRLNLTGGGNAIVVGAVGLGGDGIHEPANVTNDLNTTYLSQRVVLTP